MIALALAWLGRNRLVAALGGVLLLIALLGGAYAKGRLDEAALVKQRAATAEARQDTRAATAGGHADLSRQTDVAATAAHEEVLKHADDAQPDAAPSRARLAQSCQRLCDQGADLAKVAACAGFVCRGQASAHH